MAQLQMVRELTGLKGDFMNVDINSGYTTSQLGNKSYIPGATGENNSPSTAATSNT